MFGKLLLMLLFFVPGSAIAQESDIVVDVLVDQQIADEDLTVDVEAEILPDDSFQFVLENALFHIRRAFTFQAERKVQLDQDRLHSLDRKLTACGEVGDTDCVERLERMIAAAEERARRHFERKQEVLGNIEEHFEDWRQRRQDHIEEVEELAQEREDMHDELMEELIGKREEARERREQRLDEIFTRKHERLEHVRASIEQRQQNREHLIEVRSQNVSDRLDDARERAAERQNRFNDQLAE